LKVTILKPTTQLTPKTAVFKALVYSLTYKNKKNSKKFGTLADDIAIHLSDEEVEVVKSTEMEAAHLIRDFSWATIITDDDLRTCPLVIPHPGGYFGGFATPESRNQYIEEFGAIAATYEESCDVIVGHFVRSHGGLTTAANC
jgi:hypothetical protein